MTCENECTLDFETGDRYCPKVARWYNGCPFDGLETNAADDENLNNRKEPEMANETIEDIVRDVRLLADRIEASQRFEENARLEAENAKMKEERDELFWENVKLRSMANGTPDDEFGRLLTLADGWDANHPFSPDEGKLMRKAWAKIVKLQMANAKMREALTRIAGGESANNAFEEVAWNMVQWAKAALAAEGGTK